MDAGIVNPPVWHASTILFDSLAALDEARRQPDQGLFYGRRGTPTQWALEAALTELEPGAAGTKLYPSGVAAVAAALLTVVRAGDHVLMVDTAYEPSRAFADRFLKPLGIATTFYPPTADVTPLLRPETRAILLESPGSLSFEVQDVPAIVAVARQRNIATIMDNTWATPQLFPAIGHGVDFSVQALTKYTGGHSDLMMGSVTTTAKWWGRLKTKSYLLGYCVGPDDAYLALRGLRTLGLRLDRQGASALTVAEWLRGHPAVARVLHPALPDDPGHALWQRDFTGTSGLFAFVLKRGARRHTAALIDDLAHFGIGFSWGGYESLILPVELDGIRTATSPDAGGQIIRLSIGLEDPADLIADLAAGLDRYEAQF
ncbi:MAG: cystathionine beta-lyase [Sphingomonadaceae bacterium]|nr:cystathionine beta-lyase [Sphingomonadaceae bacterium]